MLFRIVRARAVKEGIIRFNVEINEIDASNGSVVVVGEYEIALDIEPFVDVEFIGEDNIEINVNKVGLEQAITTTVEHLQMTQFVASQLEGHDWKVDVKNESELSYSAE